MKPVMNLDEVKFDDLEENGLYTSSRGRISDHIGARNLGYNLTVLPPGKAQCPFHCHHGEEEMFFLLEGEGELRFGDKRLPIRKHDVIACPPGGPEVAHQIINTGTATMRYLALSTLVELEACEYPDSQKVMVASAACREARLVPEHSGQLQVHGPNADQSASSQGHTAPAALTHRFVPRASPWQASATATKASC